MLSSVLRFNSGVFHFHEELPTQSYISSNADISLSTFASNDNLSKSSSRIIKGNKVCLLNVPSFMIPCEILKYFTKPYLDKILSMQILRHIGDHDDKYLVYLELDCELSAKNLIHDFDGQPLSTLEQISCVLYSIRSVHLSTADDGESETDYQYDEKNGANESATVGSTSCGGVASTSSRFLSSSPSSSTSSFMLRTRALSLSSFPSALALASSSPTNSGKMHPLTASKAQNDNSALHILDPDDLDTAAPAEGGLCVEENFCPVCLEVINSSKPHSFTTACQHTYHIDCISKLEGPQCPVCRFEHDSALEYLSACSDCGWQGSGRGQMHTDRVPRNGTRGIRTQGNRTNGELRASSSSSSSSSNGGNNNWIDGEHTAQNDGNNDSEYDSTHITATNTSDDPSNLYHAEIGIESEVPCDLWVCLVCGFIGCGSSHCNHIRDHYERHLHAYAMNTDNKCVWDFAGDGWVHRLVLNESDSPSDAHTHTQEWNESEGVDLGSEGVTLPGEGLSGGSSRDTLALRNSTTSTTNTYTARDHTRLSRSRSTHDNTNTNSSANHRSLNGDEHRLKLVEIPDPHSRAGHRSRVMPLTGGQEELAVNRKLEYAAQHYTRMVTWQLQHNREQHELRLQRLRNFISTETACGTDGSSTTNTKISLGGTGTWIDRIQQLVASEKIKLLKQLESARLRLQGAEKEVDVLKALNVSLRNNQVEWQKRLETAKGNVQVYQNTVIKAASKVKTLMQKLDEGVAPKDPAVRIEGLETGGTGTRDSSSIIAPSSSTNIFHHSAG